MANETRLTISDTFEYGYKVVSNVVNGRIVYSVVDEFGNILNFFYDEGPKLIPLSYEKCFALGNDQYGKKQFCLLYSSYRDPEKNGCKIITSVQGVTGINGINRERLLLLTDYGLCFFDTNDLEVTSDFYDSLRPAKNDKNGLWVYEKTVTTDEDNYSTILFGIINLDGQIENTCYDQFFKKERLLDMCRCGLKPYDIIVTDDIVTELNNKRELDKQKTTKSINSLVKRAEKKVSSSNQ